MEAYIEFCNNMRAFRKAEEDKAYSSVLKRFQIRMSVLLHDLKPLHDKYVKAVMSRDRIKADDYERKLIYWYEKWQVASDRVLGATVDHLVEKINDHVAFALDACNYRNDPYDTLFVNAPSLVWSFGERMKKDQSGKDLLLVAYSGRDYFSFYDEIPVHLRPRDFEVLSYPPSAKKPRVVPFPKH